MSTHINEIAGAEFDWFAKDAAGNIGLFATAGEGIVPDVVVRNFKEHAKITNTFESPNWGSENVWADYSVLGFYVYDWSLPGGPYKLKKSPTGEMSRELQLKIETLSSLYNLKVKFCECHVFEGF